LGELTNHPATVTQGTIWYRSACGSTASPSQVGGHAVSALKGSLG
jgi:hypothetical protein